MLNNAYVLVSFKIPPFDVEKYVNSFVDIAIDSNIVVYKKKEYGGWLANYGGYYISEYAIRDVDICMIELVIPYEYIETAYGVFRNLVLENGVEFRCGRHLGRQKLLHEYQIRDMFQIEQLFYFSNIS